MVLTFKEQNALHLCAHIRMSPSILSQSSHPSPTPLIHSSLLFHHFHSSFTPLAHFSTPLSLLSRIYHSSLILLTPLLLLSSIHHSSSILLIPLSLLSHKRHCTVTKAAAGILRQAAHGDGVADHFGCLSVPYAHLS